MCSSVDGGDLPARLTADELAVLTPRERLLLTVLITSFTLEELAVLTAEDITFFLSLEHEGLSDIPADEALRVALDYQDRVRRKRLRLSH